MTFIDPSSIREAIEEESLTVRTGIRSGDIGPDPVCYYGVIPPEPPYPVDYD
jgi:hypothetical protein